MTTVVWPHRANPLIGLMTDAEKAARRTGGGKVRSDKMVRVIMAGGGTGGHLYPGLAVADALKVEVEKQGGEVELIWAATPRAVDQRLLSKFGAQYVKQPVQPLVKSVKKVVGFWKGWRESCRLWAQRFSQEKVDCVVALGGYAAGPAAYIAAKRGIPVVLLNPDALPGLANRFLLKRADVIVTQWPLGAAYRKGLRGVVKPLGCPIREELVGRDRAAAVARLGIDENKKTLIVTGASLGAKTINDAMLELLKDEQVREAFRRLPIANCQLPIEGEHSATPGDTSSSIGNRQSAIGNSTWQIVHLAGMDQAEAVRKAYASWPDVAVKVIDYCDDMASVWAVADLAIARGGASTCAELTACGVPSILLPYPFHKDLHQKHNAMELVRAGAAVIVDDTKEPVGNAAAIKSVLGSLLYDDALRDTMADGAKIAGKPFAAAEIAREILALTAGRVR